MSSSRPLTREIIVETSRSSKFTWPTASSIPGKVTTWTLPADRPSIWERFTVIHSWPLGWCTNLGTAADDGASAAARLTGLSHPQSMLKRRAGANRLKLLVLNAVIIFLRTSRGLLKCNLGRQKLVHRVEISYEHFEVSYEVRPRAACHKALNLSDSAVRNLSPGLMPLSTRAYPGSFQSAISIRRRSTLSARVTMN